MGSEYERCIHCWRGISEIVSRFTVYTYTVVTGHQRSAKVTRTFVLGFKNLHATTDSDL